MVQMIYYVILITSNCNFYIFSEILKAWLYLFLCLYIFSKILKTTCYTCVYVFFFKRVIVMC